MSNEHKNKLIGFSLIYKNCSYLIFKSHVVWSSDLHPQELCFLSFRIIFSHSYLHIHVYIRITGLFAVYFQWCGCVEDMEIRAPSLKEVDFNGTTFSKFVLHSSKLQNLTVAGLGFVPDAHLDVQ